MISSTKPSSPIVADIPFSAPLAAPSFLLVDPQISSRVSFMPSPSPSPCLQPCPLVSLPGLLRRQWRRGGQRRRVMHPVVSPVLPKPFHKHAGENHARRPE